MFFRILASSVLLALACTCPVAAQSASHPGRNSSSGTGSDQSPALTGAAASAYAQAQEIDGAGNLDTAIAAYRKFIKLYPASKEAAAAQFRIAELLRDKGDANKAFDAYQTLITRYPDTPNFEKAVSEQILIANSYLDGRHLNLLGWAILPATERSQKMYEMILKNAPYSKNAPIAQFNLGLSFERQNMVGEAHQGYQTVLDKYPNSDVADDALYQIGYIYMRSGLTGNSQDISSLVLAKETYEDFLIAYPKSEKLAQAKDNLKIIGSTESNELMSIAKYYDWSKNYRAAVIYYNDVIRKQPKTKEAEFAKTRIEELRSQVGEDGLRVGSDKAESGEKLALRRRLQAQVETSALSDYAGPPKKDFVPDELPVVRQPRLRTNSRDVQPLPAPVEPLLPTP